MRTYYDVDLRHAKLREFAFGTPFYMMPLVALVKFAGFRFPGSTDDPPVEALAPFEVDEAALPEDIRAKFEPLTRELAALGFREPIFHSIPYALHATRSYWATFLHPSGQAWARIHCRIWSGEGKDRVFLFPMFFTEFDDGSFLITSAGKPDMVMPEGARLVNQIGAGAEALWERHGVERDRDFRLQPRRIAGHNELRAAMERLHVRIRDYLVGRRIFQPLSEAEQQRLQGQAARSVGQDSAPVLSSLGQERNPALPVAAVSVPGQDNGGQDWSPVPRATPADAEEAAVFVELERIQNRQGSRWNMLLVLFVSLLLFWAAWNMGQQQELLWTIVPILLFHELGHYLAMRWFGYRNLRMFFIPFLGAAVAGKHYNVAGWKKAVVALLGPVPGIIVGGVLGFAGIVFNQSWLAFAALFMVIINGFNLLPLLPLDGGWVMHAVLFVRHPVLDAVFRGIAILALALLGWLLDDKIFLILPAMMLLSLPMAWRIARVAHRLRSRNVVSESPDAWTIPEESARTILAELRATPSRIRTPQMLAEQVAQVFETLNARPPGVGASLALLAVHGVSFLAALVLAAVIVLGTHFQGWKLGDIPEHVPIPPAHSYEPGQTAVWRGPTAPTRLSDSRVTLIATCGDAAAAKEAFDELSREAPPDAVLRWFGHDLLLTLPADQKASTEQWLARLRTWDAGAILESEKTPSTVRMTAEPPPGAEGEALDTELRDYLEVLNHQLLIPPWSPAWLGLPVADLERFRKARRTLHRLHVDLPRQSAQRAQLIVPPRSWLPWSNRDEVRQHEEAYAQAFEAEKQRLLEQIRAEGEDTVDHAMIPLWDSFLQLRPVAIEGKDPKAQHAAFMKERNLLLQKMAERMGRLPLEGDRPQPGSDLAAVRFGAVSRHAGTLHLFIHFRHPHEGLPALAEWLSQRGAGDLKYEFSKTLEPGDDEP
jgi:Zn-dependent protease